MRQTAMIGILTEALSLYEEEFGGPVRTQTFEEAGMLTNDQGIVVKVAGMEFQITVVRSK